MTLANAGPYFVVASDTTGSVTSTVAVLEVDPTFVKITTDPVVTNRLVYYAYSGAWADYNREGSLDLLVADGGARLFINNNEGTFREATKNEVGSWAGVYNTCYAANWVDFDNDGWLDLFICAPKSRLLKNLRDGRMADVGIAEVGPIVGSTTFAGTLWLTLNNDSCLGLLSGGQRNPGHRNYLFTNDGTGRFAQVTQGELVTTVHRTQHVRLGLR